MTMAGAQHCSMYVLVIPRLLGGYRKYTKECVDNPEGLSHIAECVCTTPASRRGIVDLYHGNGLRHCLLPAFPSRNRFLN